VLLVEDDPDMRLLLGLILREDAELEVMGKDLTADQALDLAVSHGVRPDVIVLDHHLGGGRYGLSLAPELKARCPGTRILMFTGFVLRGEACKASSVDAVVRKDQIRQLLPTVRHLLQLPIAS
jgi:CheY-like chemotaxis protein